MTKQLWTTVDYIDDVLNANRHYTPDDLDAMMKYNASLGCTCVQWIFDTIWTLYDDDAPGGFDLLETACNAAHRHGMKFIVIFKPFEGATAGNTGLLPHGLGLSADAPVIREMSGYLQTCRLQVIEHPEWSVARPATDAVDPGGRIAAVRLVKSDDAPSPFAGGDLSIWTSNRNGGYVRYHGPVDLSDRLNWRFIFPYSDQPYRVVTLGGLELPKDTQYVMVRRETGGEPFANEVEHIAELVNEGGQVIPSTPALRPVKPQQLYDTFKRKVELELTRFARRPEARAIVGDRERFLNLCEGMYSFDAGWERASLDRGQAIVIARGKSRWRTGDMHPIYPEVRQNWLDHVRFCIDRGVDGVNMRVDNHNLFYEPYCFGFNPPVVERMTTPNNFAEARRINGEAYTQFLREAAEMLHAAGRQMGVHVHGHMLRHDDRAANAHLVPMHFEWQWEQWVKEFADFIEFRGAANFRPENQLALADRIGLAARDAGVPMVYQSMRGGPVVHYNGPHHALAAEMDRVRHHPDVAAYNLYEVADFTRIDPHRGFEGSTDIADLIRRHWNGS